MKCRECYHHAALLQLEACSSVYNEEHHAEVSKLHRLEYEEEELPDPAFQLVLILWACVDRATAILILSVKDQGSRMCNRGPRLDLDDLTDGNSGGNCTSYRLVLSIVSCACTTLVVQCGTRHSPSDTACFM